MDAPVNLMQSSTSSSEVVYGGANSVAGSEESRVMSEKVQMLASAIYKEFELMIRKHGQESVKDLMPLVVNVLENLDIAYLEKEEHLVDLEMLKEENEQLLNQFERERQMRRTLDQKFMDMEEGLVEQNREMESKVESLESIVRMLELRAKNAADHANRLEEREADQKLEYDKLHERYNELLRTHIEHVERTKFLMGAEMFDMAQSLPINPRTRNSMAMSVVDSNVRGISDIISAVHMSQSTHANVNLANHISNERDWQEEFGNQQTVAEILQTPRDEKFKTPSEIVTPRADGDAKTPRTDDKAEKREKSAEQKDASEENANRDEEGDNASLDADLTGQLVDPAEFASAVNDTFIGMGREVENLIKENTELMETKNALNIVKNDLIARVDELSSEHEILREEVRSLEMVKLKMSDRMRDLEAELKEFREKRNQEEAAEEQEDVPIGQRKRFTRVEMARVLLERNQYKEKLIELQEAMKFTEMQRAKRVGYQGNSSRTGIWDFFSSLFGDGSGGGGGHHHHHHHHRASSQSSTRRKNASAKKSLDAGSGSGNLVLQARKSAASRSTFDIDMNSVHEKRMAERRQQYKAVSQHMKKEDDSRTQAYGWSIPATVDTASASASIPVPVCCRPLLDRQPFLKIWCATSVLLHGGRTADGTFVVGDPLLGCDPTLINQKDLKEMNNSSLCDASSLIWVCSSNERRSFATILDANNPNNILECFIVCAAHLLCVASVPGVHQADVRADEDFRSKLTCDGGYLKETSTALKEMMGDWEAFGAVSYVPLRRSDCNVEEDDGDDVPTYCALDEKSSPKRSRDFSINNSVPTDDSAAATSGDAGGGKVDCHRQVSLRKQVVVNMTVAGLESVKSENERLDDASAEPSPQIAIATTVPMADALNTLAPTPLLKTVEESSLQQLADASVGDDADTTTTEVKEENEIRDAAESATAANSLPSSAASLPLHIREALAKYETLNENTTAMPTIWMGSENDYIFIHSGALQWRRCLRRIKMLDAVLHILHVNGRVFAALANGTIAVFHRDSEGNWSDEGYNVIHIGSNSASSVCHLLNVDGRVWAAYRNCVVIINSETLKVERVFVAHPRRDSQVRHMVHVAQGVWLSIRLDSTIRLYHARTCQHLQDIDIEPYITKMLGTNKLDFLHLRITSLVVLNMRLWIGTGTGVIISVPLCEETNSKIDVKSKPTDNAKVAAGNGNNASVAGVSMGPGGLIRVYSSGGGSMPDELSSGIGVLAPSFSGLTSDNGSALPIPYCNMTQAQLSFHGHKDSVRFFLPVLSEGLSTLTQSLETRKFLMISGGDGYIDFRLGEDEDLQKQPLKEQVRVRDMSHLIIWEIECPTKLAIGST